MNTVTGKGFGNGWLYREFIEPLCHLKQKEVAEILVAASLAKSRWYAGIAAVSTPAAFKEAISFDEMLVLSLLGSGEDII